MSLTTTGKYSLSVINPASVTVPWLSSQCSISEAPIEQQTSDQIPGGQRTSTVCATTCSNNDFTLRADGMCKNQYKALVALVDDGLPPLCHSAKPVLANFITCGLKHLLPSLKHADFHPPSVKVKFDTRLNRTLYVVSLQMDLPHLVTGSLPMMNQKKVGATSIALRLCLKHLQFTAYHKISASIMTGRK